jgi:hypothetical protein
MGCRPCGVIKETAFLSKDTKVSPPSQLPSKAIRPSAKSPPALKIAIAASTAGRFTVTFPASSKAAVSLRCLCEFVWVLRRVYGFAQQDISFALDG